MAHISAKPLPNRRIIGNGYLVSGEAGIVHCAVKVITAHGIQRSAHTERHLSLSVQEQEPRSVSIAEVQIFT